MALYRDDWETDDDKPDELLETIDCPHCGAEVYHEAEWCPHCDRYLSEEDTPHRKPNWVVITALILVALMLLPYVVSLLR